MEANCSSYVVQQTKHEVRAGKSTEPTCSARLVLSAYVAYMYDNTLAMRDCLATKLQFYFILKFQTAGRYYTQVEINTGYCIEHQGFVMVILPASCIYEDMAF